MRIVREQVDQIKQSFAATSAVPKGERLTVYYVTIGAPNVLTVDLMRQYCGDAISCQSIQHIASGREVVILGHLHEYCKLAAQLSSTSKTDARVVYLHNKGSFHFHERNENWRPILTDAALSELCLGPQAQASCNVCGLHFFTQWTLFFPGNMFASTCEYVAELIPPRDFEGRLEQAIETVVELRLKGEILNNLLPDRKDYFGLDRYSDEHWIASHPNLKPCDCDPSGAIWKFQRKRFHVKDLKWGKAPRTKGPPADGDKKKMQLVESSPDLRLREYFFLPGNLIKWFSLYNQAPKADSWAWNWFPDGAQWRANVKTHGIEAVEKVTRPYASDRLLNEPAFALKRSMTQVWEQHASPSTLAIFYDAFIPVTTSDSDLTAQLKAVLEQVGIVSASLPADHFGSTSIFLSTYGHTALEKTNLCSHAPGLECKRLSFHESERLRGETLWHVHSYCRKYPDRRVVYLQNVIPGAHVADEVHMMRLILHITKSVTSKVCLDEVKRPDSCNLCGLVFYTIPAFMMIGNMWASSCSYINQLLPPEEFIQRMRTVIKKALVQKLWTRINFGILEERLDRLGLDGYAMEHWVGSNPFLLPCEATDQKLEFWMEESRDVIEFKLSLGAHHFNAPFDHNVRHEHAVEMVRMQDSLRMREYYFLAGNLLKWHLLYGNAPPKSSLWVWTFFPDGAKWLDGVVKYGSQVVQIMTSQYADSGAAP